MYYFFSTHKKLTALLLLLFVINIFTYLFIWSKLPFAPELIPLWHSMPKGEKLLSSAKTLYAIPVLMTWIFLSLSLVALKFIKTQKQLVYPFFAFAAVSYIYLLWSLYLITDKFLFLSPSFISQEYKSLVIPFVVTFGISYFITPLSIKFIKLIGAVDNPSKHKHPAMLITKIVPRGGSIPFIIAFILGVAIFMGFPKKVLGIVLGALIASVIAVIDDKYDLNRNLRLLVLLPIAILVIIVSFFLVSAVAFVPLMGDDRQAELPGQGRGPVLGAIVDQDDLVDRALWDVLDGPLQGLLGVIGGHDDDDFRLGHEGLIISNC